MLSTMRTVPDPCWLLRTGSTEPAVHRARKSDADR